MKKLLMFERSSVIQKEQPNIMKLLNPIKLELNKVKFNYINFVQLVKNQNLVIETYLHSAIDSLINNEYFLLIYFQENLTEHDERSIEQFFTGITDRIINSDEIKYLTKLKEDTRIFKELLKLINNLQEKSNFYFVFSVIDSNIELDLSFYENEREFQKIDLTSFKNLISLKVNSYFTNIFINQLKTIKSLRNLYLEKRDLQEVPNFISELNNLEFLSLKHNKISLNDECVEILNKLNQLIILNLSHNELKNSSFIHDLKHIQMLDISYNLNFPYHKIEFSNSLRLVKIGPLQPKIYDFVKDNYRIEDPTKLSVKIKNKKFISFIEYIDKINDLLYAEETKLILTISKN